MNKRKFLIQFVVLAYQDTDYLIVIQENVKNVLIIVRNALHHLNVLNAKICILLILMVNVLLLHNIHNIVVNFHKYMIIIVTYVILN